MMQARKVALSLLPLLLLFSTAIGSPGQEFWITIGKETLDSSMKQIGLAHFNVEKAVGDAALVKINEEALPALSKLMHHEFKRCGGYFRHNSYEDALETLALNRSVPHTINKEFVDYSINSQLLVKSIIQNVRAVSIEGMIRQLANFKNRYYKSKHGINAANWVADFWRNLAKERSDTKVELFEHSQSPQPSVILTIKGRSDELIIIGGHLDSIAGWWNRSNAKSPGADDNASGIATMTEVIRVLLQRDFVPEKTIKFIAYAAEEVGLIGSQDIARFYSDNSEVVAGVLQLDMTNYKGSDSLDIVLISDYTNAIQNEFLGKLITTYLDGVKWEYDKCGYACSDHSSWTKVGYPASFPFESKKRDMNGNIHTARDTIDVSDGNALHAAKFAQLAVAFVVELDR